MQRICVPCFVIAGLFLVAGIAAAVQGQQESAPLLAVARIAPGGPDVLEVVLQAVPLEASPSLANQVSTPRPEPALFVSIRKLCDHTLEWFADSTSMGSTAPPGRPATVLGQWPAAQHGAAAR